MNSRLLLVVLSFVLIYHPWSETHAYGACTSYSRLFLKSPPAACSEHFGFLMDSPIVLQSFLSLSLLIHSSPSVSSFYHSPPLQPLSSSSAHTHFTARSAQAAAVNKRSCHCAFDEGIVLFVCSEPGTNYI